MIKAEDLLDINALTENHEIIHTDKFGDCITVYKALKAIELALSISNNDWLEFNSNKHIFRQFAIRNCLCKFDNGMEIRYNDFHPRAIMTHFKL